MHVGAVEVTCPRNLRVAHWYEVELSCVAVVDRHLDGHGMDAHRTAPWLAAPEASLRLLAISAS